MGVKRLTRGLLLLVALDALLIACLGAAIAQAAPPSTPNITEPSVNGQIVHPADVHMEANGFSDPDGNTHQCSDWEIWTVDSPEKIWQAPCVTFPLSVHIHLGDGTFVGSSAGDEVLNYDTDYTLRVRFRDSSGTYGSYATRDFRTSPDEGPGVPGDNPWVVDQPGYEVEKFASDLQLPVDIAFVPNPGPNPTDPLLYVTELYGTIKVVTRDGTVSDYATDLLNFDPTGVFPGSGEQGLTGIVVEPTTGDVFASMVYEDEASSADPKPHYGKVVRFHSEDGGMTAATQTEILDLYPSETGPSHQVSNLTIGPDGKLYVHSGDGFDPGQAQYEDSFLGKVLRVDQDGGVPTDNPLYDGPPITPQDYVWARGFRNPFGGAWRASNGAHYEVENGPDKNDRLARIDPGPFQPDRNYGFDGTGESMLTNALYSWSPTHAPVNIAFIQPETFVGSGFPASQQDHAFVSESGPTYAFGPQSRGKRIVEFDPDQNGEFGRTSARTLVEYNGVGYGTVVGLAAGPDGLYFTDLYKDVDASSPIERGANIWRVSYVATDPPPYQPPGDQPPGGDAAGSAGTSKPFDLAAAKRKCKKKFRGQARRKCIKRAKRKAGA